ncbi:MAG: hypothetical protein QM498_10275, partial [Desulfobacterium sp.]
GPSYNPLISLSQHPIDLKQNILTNQIVGSPTRKMGMRPILKYLKKGTKYIWMQKIGILNVGPLQQEIGLTLKK